MALRAWGAFAAGVTVGWGARSVLGSGRELLVRSVVTLHDLRERVNRVAAEQVEWVEDTFAEGRARYEARKASEPVDEASPARVVPHTRRPAA
jgi:hypothetical protein